MHSRLIRSPRTLFGTVLSVSLGVPVLLLIFALKPLVTVRIGRIRSQRLGSFVGDLDRHLAYRLRPRRRVAEWYFLDHKSVCSTYVEELWRRKILILPRIMLIFPYSTIKRLTISRPRLKDHLWSTLDIDHWSPVLGDRDPWNILDSAPPTLGLSGSEERRGRDQLNEIGLSPESRIALLIGRDSSYGTTRGDLPELHTHRNVRINDFESAIDLLRNEGFTVFRMGSMVQESLTCADEKTVFDYATNGMRSEFLDVYLASVCSLCVSVSTGYDALPTLFRKPTLYANMVPIGMYPSFRHNALALCKSFVDDETGDFISLKELYRRGCLFDFRSPVFEQNGVRIIDNSPELLRSAVGEAISHLVANEPWSSDDESIWAGFREQFQPLANMYPIQIHGELRARYSPSGLRSGHFGIYPPTM